MTIVDTIRPSETNQYDCESYPIAKGFGIWALTYTCLGKAYQRLKFTIVLILKKIKNGKDFSFQVAVIAKKSMLHKDSCKSHEYRCYFNPRTKSCASCSFFNYSDYKYATGHSIAIRTCFQEP
jgi:hypothetical protein